MPTNNHNYPTEVKGLLEVASIQRGCSDAVGASCLCFFGFLRMGEVMVLSDKQYDPDIHLSYLEVRVNDRSHPQWLEVRVSGIVFFAYRYCSEPIPRFLLIPVFIVIRRSWFHM